MSVLFLFIDGVGLGDDTESNPFKARRFDAFTKLAGDQPFNQKAENVREEELIFKDLDATLDVEGLPQSGTGQATLFTGKNAAKLVGRHFGPFPHSEVKPILSRESIFHKAVRSGKSCYFMNAYPEIYFERAQERDRWSCTTLMVKSAGLALNTIDEVRQGRAITAGITQKAWRDQLGLDVPVIEPEMAADRVLAMMEEKDLVLHEYYLTDKAGHARNIERAVEVIDRYDRFLQQLISNRKKDDTIVLSSDHGNVEDLSVKTHTLNRVPLFVAGPVLEPFAGITSIQEISGAILDILN